MVDRDDVCVLIPTLDEVETIGDVLEGFVEQGYENLLVVDGGSTDGTVEAAEAKGARVVEQTGSGKGQALRQGFDMVEEPYVVFLDGDGTYRPDQADRLREALEDADHVLGDRFADLQPGAMPRLNQFGNYLINAAFRLVHGRDLEDILSGYRALRTDVLDRLDLEADGFGIETELCAESVRRDVSTTVVPITYEPRPAGSEANLRPFRDGLVIILTLYQLARTHNPLFYFGFLGGASTAVGVAVAAFVAYEWFARGVPHNILAMVSAAAILLGVQLVMFGVLSDLVVTLHREQMRLIERLEGRSGTERTREGDSEAAPEREA